jgi:large subunit ribosomal protein L6
MAATIVEKTIEIPEAVKLELEGRKLVMSGDNGRVIRDFSHVNINIDYEEGTLRVWAVNPRKREASLVNTIVSHVKNMIKGITEGFIYRLKIVFIHFPMTVRVNDRKVMIQNFIGERKPRAAKIVGDVEVQIDGDDVIVRGVDIEEVSQTAANIQNATKIKKKDLRKFLDGIYVYRKE